MTITAHAPGEGYQNSLATVLVSPIVGIHYLQPETDGQWWCELATESGRVVTGSGADADEALRAAVGKVVGCE